MSPKARSRGKISCPIKKNQAEILRSLCYLPKVERFALLRQLDLKTVKLVCECAYNILRGNVALTSEQKNHLRKHVMQLRALTRKGDKIEKKKQIIQRGGGAFLPALLIPIVTTLLTEVLR